MVPQTVAAFAAFLGLIAPGLAFELLRERRRPPLEQTAFREASWVALMSLLFTGLSLAVLAIVRVVEPGLVLDAGAWFREGDQYLDRHYRLVIGTVAAAVGLSLVFAVAADLLLRRRTRGDMATGGVWWQLLRAERPPGTVPWVGLHLDDGSRLAGVLSVYTAGEKFEDREIALKPNAKGEGLVLTPPNGPAEALDAWSHVVVPGEKVRILKVTYLNATPQRETRVARAARQSSRSP